MTNVKLLLSEMDAYCASSGIAPSTLGRLAGQGGDFYARLVAGGRCWPETIDKVRAYMRDHPPIARDEVA